MEAIIVHVRCRFELCARHFDELEDFDEYWRAEAARRRTVPTDWRFCTCRKFPGHNIKDGICQGCGLPVRPEDDPGPRPKSGH
jgi:hypothetical protein